MSALAGSLHTSGVADVLAWLVREERTGVLRLRHSSPEGAQRGEIVLVGGRLVGGAVYRAGGFKGTGDALVDAALCSPEDAQGAQEYAAQTAQYVPGSLAEGAERAGVPIDRVEAALVGHLEWVLQTVSGWKLGSWELVLEGLPADAADRDSAASRAFLLDRGLHPSELNVPEELSATLEAQAAAIQKATEDPDVTRPSMPAQPKAAATSFKIAVKGGDTRKSAPRPAPAPAQEEPVDAAAPVPEPPPMDTEPEFAMPPGDALAAPAEEPAPEEPAPEEPAPEGLAPEGLAPEEPMPEPPPAEATQDPPSGEGMWSDTLDAPAEAPADAETTPSEEAGAATPPGAGEDAPIGDDEISIPFGAGGESGEEPGAMEDAPPEFAEPGATLGAEATPADALPAGELPVFETPEGDLGAPDETAPPEAAETVAPEPASAGTPGSSLGDDLFADANDEPLPDPDANAGFAAAPDAEAGDEAGGADAGDLPPGGDEPTQSDQPIDWSAPGGAEAALMEAETLLDSDVLSVMLEMGSSAAAAASETKTADKILTGHLLLVDEEGQTAAVLAVPLREAGYVLHVARGLVAGQEALDRAVAEGQRPLLVADLLLKREKGTTGGLDLGAAAAAAAVPAILLGDAGPDTAAKADAAGITAVLPRPLRSDLKKDDVREAFIASVLAAIDEHRPRAEWLTPAPLPDDLETGGPAEEAGWDVQDIEKLASEVEDLPDFAMTDPAARMDALWRETTAMLSGPLTRPEILLQVLRFGAEVLTRAVLFTPVKGKLTGFGQFGIELAPGVDADETVRKIRMPLDGHPGIVRAVESRQPVKESPGGGEWEGQLSTALGGITPDAIFLGPVFCQGKLAAVLYGDMLPAHTPLPDTTNLEVILGQAGLALDRAELEARLAALEGTGSGGPEAPQRDRAASPKGEQAGKE